MVPYIFQKKEEHMIEYYNNYSYIIKENNLDGTTKKYMEFVSDEEADEYLEEELYNEIHK